jgi:hypothetical protein
MPFAGQNCLIRCPKIGVGDQPSATISENGYGDKAEEDMASQRADYFAASTLVVWDASVFKEEVIRVYRASNPEEPQVYRRGEVAEAEPTYRDGLC